MLVALAANPRLRGLAAGNLLVIAGPGAAAGRVRDALTGKELTTKLAKAFSQAKQAALNIAQRRRAGLPLLPFNKWQLRIQTPALLLRLGTQVNATLMHRKLPRIHPANRPNRLGKLLPKLLVLHIPPHPLPARQLADTPRRLHINLLRPHTRRIRIDHLTALLAPKDRAGRRREGLGADVIDGGDQQDECGEAAKLS
ncbi:hypothetical protein ETQ85_04075 [Zoogloea oleivorans]|uniref:Uncharacterized protein n=1 Tax=Zoogloea oleivorans TaxID=1552750 RepID=A0A6C2D6L2_9RHOO|nr:hypothetical protein [Zoogloea oleivorans]TYC61245.1 hypothetical protein ETQ85_04075 [Zoogloea oleivorans]